MVSEGNLDQDIQVDDHKETRGYPMPSARLSAS